MKVKVLSKITSNFTTEDESNVVILPGEYQIEDERAKSQNLLQRFKAVPTLVEILEEVTPPTKKTLHDLKTDELKALLTAAGVEFDKRLKKDELIKLAEEKALAVAEVEGE